MTDPLTLPIYELEERIVAALRSGNRLLLRAPTGSGKSTQLPRILLRRGLLTDGDCVVLQPRRLAARLLAARVAREEGESAGGVIGYRIRMDSVVSSRTRVTYATEGVLLRRMVEDPSLRGTAVLVFDEFHERHLHTDVALGWALRLQATVRPDLRIVVMSATLETERIEQHLAPCASLASEGRAFPVAVSYLPARLDPERSPVWEAAARAAGEWMAAHSEGHVLIFMPGSYEISRCLAALAHELRGLGAQAVALHGEMPAEQQDAAVAEDGPRRVIVATNVAETSITIPGVRCVVDSGLARVARHDPHRGIDTLLVEKISRASADQRAGRAGRTAPGSCVRLWTEREHHERAAHDLPEVKRVDLAEAILSLRAAGVENPREFPWVEAPEPRALERAEQLLSDLGATEGPGGSVSALGRRMLSFPVHPRYGRMLIEAGKLGCVRLTCIAAALTQVRSLFLRQADRRTQEAREDLFGGETSSDFLRLALALRWAEQQHFSVEACARLGIHAQTARQAAQLQRQFLELAARQGLDAGESRRGDGTALRRCLLAGFSDQVARRLDRGTLRCALVHGRRGVLAREAAPQDAALLVIAEVEEIGRGSGEVETLLTMASAIEPSWLEELYPQDLVRQIETAWDAGTRRVVARETLRFRDLSLESKDRNEVPAEDAARILASLVERGDLRLEGWDETVEQWFERIGCLRAWMPELELPEFTAEEKRHLLEQICHGAFGARDLKDRPVRETTRDWLSAPHQAAVDRLAPERIELPSGRRARIRYQSGQAPVVSSRLQDFYGWDGAVTIAQGRVRLRIELLAPNQRAVQVTDNLSGFWRETYPKVKAELQRRYPRHEWR